MFHLLNRTTERRHRDITNSKFTRATPPTLAHSFLESETCLGVLYTAVVKRIGSKVIRVFVYCTCHRKLVVELCGRLWVVGSDPSCVCMHCLTLCHLFRFFFCSCCRRGVAMQRRSDRVFGGAASCNNVCKRRSSTRRGRGVERQRQPHYLWSCGCKCCNSVSPKCVW